MTVLVLSPTRVLAEALVVLLNNHSFSAHSNVNQHADIALFNLIGIYTYPPPLKIPTFALIENDPRKAHDLLAQGYRHCFDSDATVSAVVQVLKAE